MGKGKTNKFRGAKTYDGKCSMCGKQFIDSDIRTFTKKIELHMKVVHNKNATIAIASHDRRDRWFDDETQQFRTATNINPTDNIQFQFEY